GHLGGGPSRCRGPRPQRTAGPREPERRKSSAVQRRPAETVRTACPIALREPTRTTSRLARVTAVYSRLRWSIIHAPVVTGMTTAGYSLPWERWMVTA